MPAETYLPASDFLSEKPVFLLPAFSEEHYWFRLLQICVYHHKFMESDAYAEQGTYQNYFWSGAGRIEVKTYLT